MDAYIVLLGLVTSYFMSNQVVLDATAPAPFPIVQWPLLALLFLIPVSFSLSRIPLPIQYDKDQASDDLSVLRSTVQSFSQQGPVLFIYERHLLTFDMIPDVPVVPEYEVVTLTEMAISGNQPYLDGFTRICMTIALVRSLHANKIWIPSQVILPKRVRHGIAWSPPACCANTSRSLHSTPPIFRFLFRAPCLNALDDCQQDNPNSNYQWFYDAF